MPTFYLPPKYLITPDYCGNEKKYLSIFKKSLEHGIKLVQFRSKNLSLDEYSEIAKIMVKIAHSYKAKFIINTHISLVN